MVKDGHDWLNPGANATAPPPWTLSLTVSLGFMAIGIAAFASSGPVVTCHPSLSLQPLRKKYVTKTEKIKKTKTHKNVKVPADNGVGFFPTCGQGAQDAGV